MSDLRIMMEHIASLGYDVSIEEKDGRLVLRADSQETGDTYQVRADAKTKHDKYLAACELAEMVGIDLMDG